MGLPIVQLPSDEHTFSNGQKVKYRGLSRAEALQITGTDAKVIETLTIAFATGTPLEETELWLDETPQQDARELFDAIIALSGLTPEMGKDEGGDSPSENSTVSTISSPKT
jgi:hypothetical protein